MPHLSVRLFGPVEVTLDREVVAAFKSDKARALLAYLAVEAERPHRREKLAGLLWPEWPEQAARGNLRRVLSNLRLVIGDHQATPPFLHISRHTIQFNCASDAWVDATVFTDLLETKGDLQQMIAQLGEAVELYQGDFLEGFSIPDSAAFEEWALLNRERFRRLVMVALHRLGRCHEQRGDYESALRHAWRQVELEPWQEKGHQQVMRLLALSGQRSTALAQYESCRHLLAEELGVDPSRETTALYEQIRDGELSRGAEEERGRGEFVAAAPAFLTSAPPPPSPPAPFVARERELARLGTFLEQALKGQSRVVFITGGPGRGKTALLGEFVRRAMDAHPDLLVARGDCSAYSGVGDPYLPFRDVMAMLTGDVKVRWAAGSISHDHARRLWDALPLAIQALLAHGASLIGTVLAGEALLSRAAAALPDRADWLERLQALTGPARSGSVDLEQSFLFEQYTNVLRTLADQHPLVLVLDDVQWADNASIGLLFHLGRRLAGTGSRILIACAYRPEEVALGRAGQRHPLEQALHEFKRTFGDVWVDLDRVDQTEGRRFVDAFLDTELNRLGEGFRAALFHRTEGHPLFTIELLRVMQERGDLVRDTADGAWIEASSLDWEKLPARVEAVIEQRVNRLDPELKEIASVASVEGEVFTVQVVAAVQKIAERPLLHQLSQELEGRHRLVREQAEVQTGPRPMVRYRFDHILVQNHLYQRLSRGERRLLHGEVAAALESLYEGQLDEIAVQLARHFHRAGDDGRAFQYFTLAAENAARIYANDEAIAHYTRAIEIAERVSTEDAASAAKARRGRGLAYETLGEFELARADHETALQVARAAGERQVEWRALLDLGKLWASRDYNQTGDCFQQALELARRMDDPALLAGSLNWMGNWYANAEDLVTARAYHQEALEIFEQLGDQRGLAATLDLLGIANLLAGDVTAGVGYYDRAIALFRELDDRPRLASSLTGRGNAGGAAYSSLALVPVIAPCDARRDLEEAIRITREVNSPAGEAWALWSLGLLYIVQGQYGQALEVSHRGLGIASEIGHGEWIVGNRSALGVLYVELLAPEEVQSQLEQVLTLAEGLRSQHWIHRATGALAAAYCLLNDLTQAQTCLETVLSPQTPMDTLNKRYCWARRAELALAQGDPAQALEIVERLIASAPGMSPGCVITFLWKLKGEALSAMGHTEEARSLLQAAIENAQATGERFLLWRLHASLGRLYCAMNRQSEAEEEFSTARQLIDELADTVPDEAVKANFLQRAHNMLGCSS
jgi:DNA-binding SARP family transcriptional activator